MTIAAMETFRVSGGDRVMRSLQLLWIDVKAVHVVRSGCIPEMVGRNSIREDKSRSHPEASHPTARLTKQITRRTMMETV